MLTLISPAKTLDFDRPLATSQVTTPDFLKESAQLVDVMRDHSADDLSKLMRISPKLGELNSERFEQWQLPFTPDNARQAILAFRGDVYVGLDADSYSQRDFTFAQKSLRILSGLYGVLKPLDLIQPYRLEMGSRVSTGDNKDLYGFWGDTITQALNTELTGHRNKSVINLASNEYFKSVRTKQLSGQVITPVFKDFSKGTYKILGFYAKKARGLMASYIIKNRLNTPEAMKEFTTDGYRFNEDFSSDTDWVFTRKV
ncbi:MAG: cytoplasmic iron level regulating protein YaaA (DUF328/UPF0246 family) [Candidatus Pseudothioglobus sp.]|jgi:cytoplasmic iron level regulating protein YaaA (DUF328/UPF0246 family)